MANHNSYKLTEKMLRELNKFMLDNSMGYDDLAKKANISERTVGRILVNKTAGTNTLGKFKSIGLDLLKFIPKDPVVNKQISADTKSKLKKDITVLITESKRQGALKSTVDILTKLPDCEGVIYLKRELDRLSNKTGDDHTRLINLINNL